MEIRLSDVRLEYRVCCAYLGKPALLTNEKIVEVLDIGSVGMEGRCGKWKDM